MVCARVPVLQVELFSKSKIYRSSWKDRPQEFAKIFCWCGEVGPINNRLLLNGGITLTTYDGNLSFITIILLHGAAGSYLLAILNAGSGAQRVIEGSVICRSSEVGLAVW